MSTLAAWIDDTLNGGTAPPPESHLPPSRWVRAWWLALIQAQERHPRARHDAWTTLWRRLPTFLTPDNVIDGQTVLNHLMGLRADRGVLLLNRAFQVWPSDQVAQTLPIGPASEPLKLEGPTHWAQQLVQRLTPVMGGDARDTLYPVPDGWAQLTHRLIASSDDRHAHWRVMVWQVLHWRDAARTPGSPALWNGLLQRMRDQGTVEVPLHRPLASLLPAGAWCPDDGRHVPCTGTLDLLLVALLNHRAFHRHPWKVSPWATALTQARADRNACPDWPLAGQRLTVRLWELLEQHLAAVPSTARGFAHATWCDRLNAWQQASLLKTLVDQVSPDLASRARLRL